MKKRPKDQPVALPLFDTAAFGEQPPQVEKPLVGGEVLESFQPLPDPSRQPVYKVLAPRDLLSSLNEPQRKAVVTTEGPVLIFAGPGSGKTRVITHRIAYLILQHQIAPRSILAVTFTNKAAGEMRERLEQMVEHRADAVVATTFHSLCARMLRRSKEFLLRFGLTPMFSIADEHDQERVIRAAIKDIELDSLDENQKSPGALRDLISKAKGDMQTPETLEKLAEAQGKFSLTVIANIYREYNRLLKKHNLLDFEDLLIMGVHLLHSDPITCTYYQQRWRYIHVDEFQDTNLPQYLLVRLLARGNDDRPEGHRNICVVGDDDQMIYTWRGASMENLERFEQDFPERTVILLEQNYRSSKTIVQGASCVIQKNLNRRAKNLWTKNAQGDPIIQVDTDTEDDEANYALETIFQLYKSGQIARWQDVAVLYRTNSQSRAVEEAALRLSIPYKIVGSTMFYHRKEIKDFLAYLRVLVNPNDDISLERIVNVPARGIGKTTLSVFQEWASSRSLSLAEALHRLPECTTLDKAPRRALASFSQIVTALRQAVDTLPFPDLLDQVGALTGLEQSLKNGTQEQRERWDNILELKRVAARFAGVESNQAISLLLEHVALISGADCATIGDEEKRAEDQHDTVLFVTLHAAKGLEFPFVFLLGVEEGLIPHSRTLLEEDIDGLEEERRLLYVGMTRAKQRLYWVRAERRYIYGRTVHTSWSRFLDAIPPSLIQGQ